MAVTGIPAGWKRGRRSQCHGLWTVWCHCIGNYFFFQAEDGIRDGRVTGVQTCALPILKYAVWEHRGLPGQPSSEGELSFTRPRRGVASWLAAPRDLRSLDFASPRAILVASIALKNLGSIFDEVQSLVTAANPNALAQMDQMQQGLGINLKDDLLAQLGGEITLEVDDIEKDQPAWKAILEVEDVA